MGFRICYLASKLPPEEFASLFNLQITGTITEMPDDVWWVASLKKSGWSLLWSEDEDFSSRSEGLIKENSHKSDIINCVVNETMMLSSCVYWSNGQLNWKVAHLGAKDIYDLETAGTLPPQFKEIRDQYFNAQKQENDCDHIFEIPLEVASTYIGFRHDTILQEEDVDKFYMIARP